jgi:hypothetical protein
MTSATHWPCSGDAPDAAPSAAPLAVGAEMNSSAARLTLPTVLQAQAACAYEAGKRAAPSALPLTPAPRLASMLSFTASTSSNQAP